jgi:predicted nucleic acid-binding Zn ribbon protein
VVVVSGRVLACLVCGVSLEGLRRDARYCSGKCRMAALRARRDGSGVPGDGSERMEVS